VQVYVNNDLWWNITEFVHLKGTVGAFCYGNSGCNFDNIMVIKTPNTTATCQGLRDKKGCSNRGECVDQDLCLCHPGYSGKYCEDFLSGYSAEDSEIAAFCPVQLCTNNTESLSRVPSFCEKDDSTRGNDAEQSDFHKESYLLGLLIEFVIIVLLLITSFVCWIRKRPTQFHSYQLVETIVSPLE